MATNYIKSNGYGVGTDGDDIIESSGVSDRLLGRAGNDTLIGGGGHDQLWGGEGSDVYRFAESSGRDTITMAVDPQGVLDSAVDTLDFSGSYLTLEHMRFIRGVPGDDQALRIVDRNLSDYNRNTATDVVISNYFHDEGITAPTYLFKFAGGAPWYTGTQTYTQEQILDVVEGLSLTGTAMPELLTGERNADTLMGLGGSDTLDGGAGRDVLNGGAGDNVLRGGVGDDTYQYGGGNDTIVGTAQDGQDTLLLGDWASQTEPTRDQVRFTQVGQDLVISVAPHAEVGLGSVTIQNYLSPDESFRPVLGRIAGAGISVWNRGNIEALLQITSNNDVINCQSPGAPYDQNLDDVFSAGQGDDLVRAGAGMDSIDGGAGDDVIFGMGGNDSLYGGVGHDLLDGGEGYNWLNGGGGNDTLVGDLALGGQLAGGSGADTYVLRPGENGVFIDVQEEVANGGGNRLVIEATSSDVVMLRGESNLYIQALGSRSGSVKVANYFLPNSAGSLYDQISFSDGVRLVRSDVERILNTPTERDDALQGTSGNDTIDGLGGYDHIDGGNGNDLLLGGAGLDNLIGGSGNDTLVGGAGDDVLFGDDGTDTYRFGSGNDIIEGLNWEQVLGQSPIPADYDIIEFSDGITPADVAVTVTNAYAGQILMSVQGDGGTLRVNGMFYSDSTTPTAAFKGVSFSDGTFWTSEDIAKSLRQGTPGRDDLYAAATGSRLEGGDGRDALNGQVGNDWLDGGADDDQVDGADGADTLVGGLGADQLSGGLGADTFVYNLGDGQDTLRADPSDTLRLGAGIAPGDVSIQVVEDFRWGAYAVLTFKQASDGITVYSGAVSGLANRFGGLRLAFADGTTYSAAEVARGGRGLTLVGTAGDDSLVGATSQDTLTGLAGNDGLTGGKGADTYIFNPGFGADVITERGLDDGFVREADDVVFGAGINSADLLLTRSETSATDGSQDLIIRSRVSPDVLTVHGQFNSLGNAIELFTFNDGTVWLGDDVAQMAAQTLRGTAGADTLTGLIGRDTLLGLDGDDVLLAAAGGSGYLAGGRGNDSLSGGAGADTFAFALGDGKDLIHADAQDTIVLDRGLTRADLIIGKLGAVQPNAVVLGFKGGTDTITLDNAGLWGSLKLSFAADGSTLSGADIMAEATKPVEPPKPVDLTLNGTAGKDKLTGGAGNDTLTGLAGNDTLAGGLGNDKLIGGKGNDTYLFNRGDGKDTIVDTDSTWFNADLLKVGNAKSNQLWLTKAGNNLDIGIIGTQDHVVIQDWYKGSANQVEKITAMGDNKSLSASKVNALVTAMAKFAAPADGVTTLPASTQTALTKILASSWA
jgi:Ca2+-binding RTX toxin-like protein